ncbi:MAG: hypothetical protein KDD62_15835, partial [Bdellovibrionales bacterium]|nr:hypothetical protein [Bdellovibrionales bacterium]
EAFDLITLDILMPVLGGIEFLSAIDDLYERGTLPKKPRIIVETAVHDFEGLKRITSYSCVLAVHHKPLKIKELQNSVEILMSEISRPKRAAHVSSATE